MKGIQFHLCLTGPTKFWDERVQKEEEQSRSIYTIQEKDVSLEDHILSLARACVALLRSEVCLSRPGEAEENMDLLETCLFDSLCAERKKLKEDAENKAMPGGCLEALNE